MVSLNCANFKINVFKAKFKTTYEVNEYVVNDNLWFQVSPCDEKRTKVTNVTITDNGQHPSYDDESCLPIVKKFIQNNCSKIEKLIEMNIQLCVGDQIKVVKMLYAWEILFLNIELNLFYSNQYIKHVLYDSDSTQNDDKNMILKPEMVEFMRIHAIKKDLVAKRESVNQQKLYLMAYRTSLAINIESKSVDEIKLNETHILKYEHRIGQMISKLDELERDLNFELDILKLANDSHLKSLENMFDENASKEKITPSREVDLNSQEFFERMKSYDFKTKFKGFFQSFLIRKENEHLTNLNEALRRKLRENI